MQPQLQETMARCGGLDPALTVVENAFTLDPDEGQGLFGAAVVMADGRVFFVPGQAGAGTAVIKPHIWDPYTGGMHQVEVPWVQGGGDEFLRRLPAAGWAGVPDAVMGQPRTARPTSTILNSTASSRPASPS